MQRAAAALFAALFLPAAAAPSAAPPLAHFSVILERTTNGWSAECEAGCVVPWRAGFTCRDVRQCDAQVDAIGIITLANDRKLDPRFSFTLKGGVTGIHASHAKGAVWPTLMWGCGQSPCRARITEVGVETLPPGK